MLLRDLTHSCRDGPLVVFKASHCVCLQVSQLLRGSPSLRQAQELIAAADSSWQELEGVIAEAEETGLAQPGVYTRQAYTWAFSMLLSRLVRLPGEARSHLMLVS